MVHAVFVGFECSKINNLVITPDDQALYENMYEFCGVHEGGQPCHSGVEDKLCRSIPSAHEAAYKISK